MSAEHIKNAAAGSAVKTGLGWEAEDAVRAEGYTLICGIDEAGRGPLAGPVVAGACILPYKCEIPQLNDSKKLSEKARERIFDEITASALSWAWGEASAVEIDEINILNASFLAMRRAVDALETEPDFLLIDGNMARGFVHPYKTMTGGDGLSPSIAAASIIAKVTRDRICRELDVLYPQYNLAKHKGYPTKEHKELIRTHGISDIHRRSFLSFLERENIKGNGL